MQLRTCLLTQAKPGLRYMEQPALHMMHSNPVGCSSRQSQGQKSEYALPRDRSGGHYLRPVWADLLSVKVASSPLNGAKHTYSMDTSSLTVAGPTALQKAKNQKNQE